MQLTHRRRGGRRESSKLQALTTSALALGGLASTAAADTPIDEIYTSYNYSHYAEDDLDRTNTVPGFPRERYEIDTQQLLLAAPLTDRIDFSFEFMHETMSGASPWYTVDDAADAPVQVMSGATIEEQRDDAQLQVNYYLDNARLGLGAGYSTENDYDAINGGFDFETHFNEKNTTLSGGIGLSFDTITPTDSDLEQLRPKEEEKRSYTLNVGLSQILTRRSLAEVSFTYNFGDGYLSDPYKKVWREDAQFAADQRPDTRHGFAWLAAYRRHIEEVDGTFHLSYQFYVDTWQVNSHTVQATWYQNYFDGALQLMPMVRYYSQREADFYVNFLKTGQSRDGDMTSDFRLSSYGAVSFGLRAQYEFHTPWLTDIRWGLKASIERYLSSGELALDSPSAENPGLVSFTVYSLGITAAF
jgi:hypothetical protein